MRRCIQKIKTPIHHPGPLETLARARTASTWRHGFLKHDCRLRILRRPGQLNARNPPWSQDCEPECKQSCAWQTGLFFSGVPARAFHGIPAPDSHLTRRLYARLCPPLPASPAHVRISTWPCLPTVLFYLHRQKPISYLYYCRFRDNNNKSVPLALANVVRMAHNVATSLQEESHA